MTKLHMEGVEDRRTQTFLALGGRGIKCNPCLETVFILLIWPGYQKMKLNFVDRRTPLF
jgi:hypothetical protein